MGSTGCIKALEDLQENRAETATAAVALFGLDLLPT